MAALLLSCHSTDLWPQRVTSVIMLFIFLYFSGFVFLFISYECVFIDLSCCFGCLLCSLHFSIPFAATCSEPACRTWLTVGMSVPACGIRYFLWNPLDYFCSVHNLGIIDQSANQFDSFYLHDYDATWFFKQHV